MTLALANPIAIDHHGVIRIWVLLSQGGLRSFLGFALLWWLRRWNVFFVIPDGPFDLDYPIPMGSTTDYENKKRRTNVRFFASGGEIKEKDVNNEKYPPFFELDIIRNIILGLPI